MQPKGMSNRVRETGRICDAFMILAKKQCLAAPGHVTGLTAYGDTIAQNFSRIKSDESSARIRR